MQRFFELAVLSAWTLSLGCGGCLTEPPDVRTNNSAAEDVATDAGSDGPRDTGNDGSDAVAGDDLSADVAEDVPSCPGENVCGDACCTDEQECVDEVCLPPCDGVRCGDASELCCTGDDVCIFDGCHTPGDPCTSSFECPMNEYCETTLGACLPTDVIDVVCEFRPPIGQFTPSPESEFGGVDIGEVTYDKSFTTPAVADIDGDGIPEVTTVLYTGALGQSVPVVLEGEDLSLLAAGPVGLTRSNAAGVAVADIDPASDGLEIVAQREGGGMIAFGLDAQNGALVELWSATDGELGAINTESAPGIADLDQDGTPEIYLGFSVVDASGNIWNGLDGGAAGGQSGNSAITAAADVDLEVDPDGNMALELIAGNRVMKIDGSMLWDNSATHSDGFPAVGDLEGDGSPEIATVADGQVFVFDADGNEIFGPIAIPGEGQGGPPTIADFDGDGRREIAAAGQGQYTVFDPDCTGAAPDAMFCPTGGAEEGVLWTVAVQDLSSSRTGSSVFDFEGDGKAEVVYNDECFLRVFDGTDGTVLFERANTTRTGSEFPIIADVDADFNAEIVVVSNNDQIDRDQCEENNANYPAGGTTGVFVYGDANDNWVTTRGIWNQHAYHITNVLDDGTVPTPEPVHYQRDVTNSFRLNIQPDGLFNAPDLVVESVEVRNPSCGDEVTVEIAVTVTNEGALGVPAGTPVTVTAANGGDVQTVADITTTKRLLPGQSETILVTWTLPAGWEMATFDVEATVDPDGTINECHEDNNVGTGESAAGSRTFDELAISALGVDDATCGVTGDVGIALTVTNNGGMPVPADLPIVLEAVQGMTATAIETVRTSAPLQPGTSEMFAVNWTAPMLLIGQQFEVRATIDPNGEVTTCSSDSRTAPADCLPPQ